METQKTHWENVYKTKTSSEVSWFQPHLEKSLELIVESDVHKNAQIIDVGGGASTLVDDLLVKGFSDLTVLDISSEALNQSKKRLREKSKEIKWIEADILEVDLPKREIIRIILGSSFFSSELINILARLINLTENFNADRQNTTPLYYPFLNSCPQF